MYSNIHVLIQFININTCDLKKSLLKQLKLVQQCIHRFFFQVIQFKFQEYLNKLWKYGFKEFWNNTLQLQEGAQNLINGTNCLFFVSFSTSFAPCAASKNDFAVVQASALRWLQCCEPILSNFIQTIVKWKDTTDNAVVDAFGIRSDLIIPSSHILRKWAYLNLLLCLLSIKWLYILKHWSNTSIVDWSTVFFRTVYYF